MTYRETIPTAVAYAVQKDTLVVSDDHPVDADGFYWDRFIPGDDVDPWCEHLDLEAPATSRCMECEPA